MLFLVGQGTKILATGGASKNKAILQVLSDVFNSPVYIQVGTILTYTTFKLLIKFINFVGGSRFCNAWRSIPSKTRTLQRYR